MKIRRVQIERIRLGANAFIAVDKRMNPFRPNIGNSSCRRQPRLGAQRRWLYIVDSEQEVQRLAAAGHYVIGAIREYGSFPWSQAIALVPAVNRYTRIVVRTSEAGTFDLGFYGFVTFFRQDYDCCRQQIATWRRVRPTPIWCEAPTDSLFLVRSLVKAGNRRGHPEELAIANVGALTANFDQLSSEHQKNLARLVAAARPSRFQMALHLRYLASNPRIAKLFTDAVAAERHNLELNAVAAALAR
jgi:hypothetical protein